jgi:hypothetical protein
LNQPFYFFYSPKSQKTKTKSEKTGFRGFQSPELREIFLSKKKIAGVVISHICGILLFSQIYPRMIKDLWSIAIFDYTFLGIIATFSASANEIIATFAANRNS